MASKINLSPQKDGNDIHTPIRHAGSLDGSNVMDSLRRRIASTALRPKPMVRNGPSQHDTINLDDSDVLEFDSAKPAVTTTQSAAVVTRDAVTPTMAELPRPPRPSSLWLQDVISNAQSVAEKIRLQSEQVESPQVWQSIESDCSSLGILTPSVMLDTFEDNGSEISDSYRFLMKNKETNQGNIKTLVSTVNDSSNSEMTQESQDNTLVASENNENSFSFSELDKSSPDFSMGISPQPDFGFDSKEFISADSSAVMKKMEDGEKSIINAAKNDPIPSFQRIDIGDFSGFIGDGEIDVSCRPSWISPEKRKLAAPRITIGKYFSLKSYHVKDLDKCLYPPKGNAYIVYPAESVPALQPNKMTTINLSDTIDLTSDDADKTITLEKSSGPEKKIGNDTLDNILDMTLVPGRDSVVSLSMIANLLNSTKGSDTVVGQLFDAAKSKSTRKTSTTVNVSSTENTPPSYSNSRETFVVSSSQSIPDQTPSLMKPKSRTPLKDGNKINALPSPSRIPILSYQKDKAPSPLKRNVPRKHAQTSPYFRQKSTTVVTSPLNKAGKSSPKIKLPICIQGCSRGVVGLPIELQVSIENTSNAPIRACLVSTSRSKHLEVCVGDHINIEPNNREYLKFEATALISGEHTVYLEVLVNFGLGGEEYTHPVLPFKLEIEAPKIIIAKQYKGIIDFGLRPEDSRKVEIFTVQNLGRCPVPLKIAIEQDLQNQCFFLLVPSNEVDSDGISLVNSMGFLLSGHEEDTDMDFLDIGIVFIPPAVSSLTANEDRVKFEAQMTLTLNLPADKSDGGVLDRCIVRGEVGRTLLLVSQTDLVLVAGKPTSLKIYNSGVVPLDLTFQATTLPDDAGDVVLDPAISIEPTKSLLIPNQTDSLSLIYKPKPGCVTPLSRELHLSYDGLSTGNIVSLICQPNQDTSQVAEQSKSPTIPLPLKTTRHQLSWGSVSSGQMSQQQISLRNSGNQNLSLNICIVNSNGGDDCPFMFLSEASEVTKSIIMQLRPGQDARVTVMFGPLRPGPAVAVMKISSSDSRYSVNKLLLHGYGGHSQILLRKVSIAHGHSWLILKPSFDDCVVGNFNVVNNGTLPACVLITSSPSSDLSSCPTVKPDNFIISARGCQTVSVRIPDVQNILSKTSSGEVVSLCTLKIVWINEISRNRLQRLLPKLNTTERVMLLRLENMKVMQSLIYAANDTQDLIDKELDIFKDFTFHTASSLCKDVSTLALELRAEGTGKTCEVGNIDGDTASPFVSFMETMLATSGNQVAIPEAQHNVQASVNRPSSLGIQWEIKPKELFLMPANSFRGEIQVFNLSTTNPLCFDVNAKEELFVFPNTGSVLPCKSATIEIQLNKPPSHHATWRDAVKIYDANDVKTVCIRVVPLAIGKSVMMQQTLRSSCSSTSSSSSSNSSSVPSSQWFTPSKSMQSPFPFSSRSNAQTPNSDTIKRSQTSTGLSKTTTSGNDVYFDTDTICFPWTKINTASTVKITLYNKSSSSDKEVRVSRVPPPFSVDPACFVVPRKWNKSISATFKPDTLNVFSERIEFTVEDQEEPLVVCFQGNSVAGK